MYYNKCDEDEYDVRIVIEENSCKTTPEECQTPRLTDHHLCNGDKEQAQVNQYLKTHVTHLSAQSLLFAVFIQDMETDLLKCPPLISQALEQKEHSQLDGQ